MGIPYRDGRRNQLWFGTENYMLWLPTPKTGADVSPQAWSTDGTNLNGGGYVFNSWDSHRQYIFEWSDTSARQVAQLVHSFADGTYGRGLIYFIDPLIYDTNVLPKRWADPSITLNYEGPSLVKGVTPTSTPTSSWKTNMLPIQTTVYDLSSISSGIRNGESVFIPIPDGFTLYLGAIYSATKTGGVYVTPVDMNGNDGTATKLTAVSVSAINLAPDKFTGLAGVRLWVGKTANDTSTVSITAMTGRLAKTSGVTQVGPWVGGQGHSGCRIVGKPTYVNNTGVNGGQVGFAATFREVGSWKG